MSVTPYGRTGPYAGRPATDFTVQAECGSHRRAQRPERPPVQAGGRTSEWAAGLYAATGGLAALLGVRAGAPGTAVDASWLEAMTVSTNLFADPMWSIMTALMGIDPPGDPRSVETPSIYPTADGMDRFSQHQRPPARRGVPPPDRARRPHRRGLRQRRHPHRQPPRVRPLGARLNHAPSDGRHPGMTSGKMPPWFADSRRAFPE